MILYDGLNGLSATNAFLDFGPFGGVNPWQVPAWTQNYDGTRRNLTPDGPNANFPNRHGAQIAADYVGGTLLTSRNPGREFDEYLIRLPNGAEASAGSIVLMLGRGDPDSEIRQWIAGFAAPAPVPVYDAPPAAPYIDPESPRYIRPSIVPAPAVAPPPAAAVAPVVTIRPDSSIVPTASSTAAAAAVLDQFDGEIAGLPIWALALGGVALLFVVGRNR